MNAEPPNPKPEKPIRTCALCEKPVAEKYTPFCSKRCADIDLGRWLNGSYVIEGSDSPSSESDAEDGEWPQAPDA